jgi:glycosyltransferase involved in cell wall biosynthesis
MKLLHIVPTINPDTGGVVEGMKQMATATMKMGHVVEVVTLDSADESWLQNLPFLIHPLGPSKFGYRYSPNLVPWLRKHVTGYDAVIVDGLWQYHGYATWKVMRKMNVPYFVFTHGMLDPWFKKTYPLKHLKKWMYWPWAEYKILRDAKAVLFTCDEERALSRESFWLYRCRKKVVSYGTVAPAGDPALQREAVFKEYPILRNKRLFLYLSRIHQKKGCDLLIQAFAEVANRDESLHLVMAGPDQTGWQKDLVELSRNLGIESRITWTGKLSGDVKWGAYHAAEAFVLPSHQENFGVVVAEALACGLPTLISNKVNIWREIETDEAGIIADDTLDGTISLFEKWLGMDTAAQALMRQKTVTCFEYRFEMGKAAQNLIDVVTEP